MDYYDRVTGSNRYYTTSGASSEPDMRSELINTLDGAVPEVAKGHYVLLRKLNRDSNNQLTQCSCVSSLGEGDKDRWCPVCWSTSFLWTESWIKTYETIEIAPDTTNAFLNKVLPPGIFNIPAIIFYARYSVDVHKDDRIIKVSLADDGSVNSPVVRTGIYKINFAWKYRADNGKSEYYKLFTHKEDVKYLNPPDYGI